MFILPSDSHRVIPKTSGIYALVQASTGRVYVGRSVNIRARVHEHRRVAAHGKRLGCTYLYRAWRAGGSDWYVFVLERDVPAESLACREAHWMIYFDATTAGCGFNLSAPTPFVPMSGDMRARISASLTGVKRGPMSAEHRAHMSAAHFGVPLMAARGKHLSLEHKAKISAARKGRKLRPMSDAHKAAISAALLKRNLAKKREMLQDTQA